MSGRDLRGRLKRLEARAKGIGPLRDRIRESLRQLDHVMILIAMDAREKGEEIDGFARFLLDAYESAPPTPGWTPRVIEPGWYGSPDLDPGKVDAAVEAEIRTCGWPKAPLDIRDVLMEGDEGAGR